MSARLNPLQRKIALRLMREAKLAQQAATTALHLSVSDFVLESAVSCTDEALPNRRIFGLGSADWQTFLTALDAPPRPMPRMGQLLKDPGFFDAEQNW